MIIFDKNEILRRYHKIISNTRNINIYYKDDIIKNNYNKYTNLLLNELNLVFSQYNELNKAIISKIIKLYNILYIHIKKQYSL